MCLPMTQATTRYGEEWKWTSWTMRGHLLKLIPVSELCRLHLGPGEAGKDPAQRGFWEIHFWDVSLGRELDVFGGREREAAEYGMFNWCLWFLIWSCSKARWNLVWKEDLDFKNSRTVPGPLWSKCYCILLSPVCWYPVLPAAVGISLALASKAELGV